MATFKYTAKRGLISGNVADTLYTIEHELQAHVPSDKVDAAQSFTASASETVFTSFSTIHSITTDYLTLTEMLQFREFLLSASSGEDVLFDLLGSIASPDDVKTGTLVVQKDFKPTRFGNQYYQYTFAIRE